MQAPNSASTLELVVNDHQMQNMSQVDLSNNRTSTPQNHQDHQTGGFGLEALKQWPSRFREGLGAKLDEAKTKSETRTQYVLEVIQAFSGIVIWILCFTFTIAVPIVMFFMGLNNLDDCPGLPSLPYLVFAIGFVMTVSNLFNLALALDLPVLSNHRQLSLDIKNTIASILNMIFNCVVAFLYILTAYKILVTSRRKQDDHQVPLECNQTIADFTFWFVTLTLSTIVILSLLGAIFFGYNRYRLAIIRGSTPRSPATQQQQQQQSQAFSNGGGCPVDGGKVNTAFYADPTNRV